MAQNVIIEHKNGERYAVSVSDFKRSKVRDGKTYEESGFKIVSNEDGSPYEAPKPKVEKPAEAPKPNG